MFVLIRMLLLHSFFRLWDELFDYARCVIRSNCYIHFFVYGDELVRTVITNSPNDFAGCFLFPLAIAHLVGNNKHHFCTGPSPQYLTCLCLDWIPLSSS